MRVIALAVIAIGCGRFSFDARDHADAKPIDARLIDGGFLDAPASLVHDYPLTTDLDDVFGGPALESLGGALVPGGFQFGQNMGLRLTGAVPQDVYTVEITFTFANALGYNKLLDFKALGADSGLYVYDTTLQLVIVPVTGCPGSDCATSAQGAVAANKQAVVTISRAADKTVTAHVDGIPAFTFTDDMDVARFDAANQVAHLAVDDNITTSEASAGIIRRVRIFDAAL